MVCFNFISCLRSKNKKNTNYYLFYFYIYSLYSQESDGDALQRATVKQLPQPASVDAQILTSGYNYLFGFLVFIEDMTEI